jgi:VWFA-related protein
MPPSPGRLASILALTCVIVPLSAQAPTFRSEVRSVALYATVTDADGRLVPDLPRDAFAVFDNGRTQPIALFSNEKQSITVAMMLDMSGSMAAELLRVRQSAERFVDALDPGDRVRIGSFGDEVVVSPIVTSDKQVLARVLREELWPDGATPLWRALDAAMNALAAESGRRVVLALSDGRDSDLLGGGPDAGDVRQRAVQQSFMVYAIGMERAIYGLTSDLAKLAEETGGGHFELKTNANLGDTFARVAEELRHQYLISYQMPETDGKIHRVDVVVRQPGCRVRTRKSYLAQRADR